LSRFFIRGEHAQLGDLAGNPQEAFYDFGIELGACAIFDIGNCLFNRPGFLVGTP
jgi:hypothetical protein